MPKTKKDKKVSLTKTTKKRLELKQHIIEDVRACVEKFNQIILFSVHNMRNSKLKNVRIKWVGSRFFFGKNKIIALALGKTPSTEIINGISELTSHLTGQCGLFFTNEITKKVLKWMNNFEEIDYARSGFVTPITITLPAGPLEFPHSIEPHLRLLGMPTALKKGIVMLLKDYTVCEKGQILTPEQTKILKLMGKPLAKFRFIAIGCFTKDKGYKQIGRNNNELKENEENKMDED